MRCHGFEIPEVIKGKLKKLTKNVLKQCKKNGFAIWEGDDSPEDVEAFTQIYHFAHWLGYALIKLDGKWTEMANQDDCAGKYLFILEDNNVNPTIIV